MFHSPAVVIASRRGNLYQKRTLYDSVLFVYAKAYNFITSMMQKACIQAQPHVYRLFFDNLYLSLRKLACAASLLETVLFALDHTGVTRKESGLL